MPLQCQAVAKAAEELGFLGDPSCEGTCPFETVQLHQGRLGVGAQQPAVRASAFVVDQVQCEEERRELRGGAGGVEREQLARAVVRSLRKDGRRRRTVARPHGAVGVLYTLAQPG